MAKSNIRRGERMVAILMYLLSHRESWYATADLVEALELDKSELRNVQRDLADLMDLPYSLIESRGVATRHEWCATLPKGTGILMPGAQDDLFNLILLQRMANRIPELTEQLDAITKQIQGQQHGEQAKLFRKFDTFLGTRIEFMGAQESHNELRNRHLLVFLRAICEGFKVKVTYQDNIHDNPTTQERVPIMVIIVNGELYIGCASRNNPDAEYVLKLSRVLKATLVKERYDVPTERIDRLRKRIRTTGGLLDNHPDKTVKVKLRFPDYFRNLVQERPYHSSAQVQQDKDGSWIMTMQVEPNRSLLQWILGWAERVEVMEPQSLRSELREFGMAMAKRYA